MTDNEIIKALKCCSETTGSECSKCPLLNVECSAYDLYKLALDLIKRQKAEIEGLEAQHREMCIGMKVLKNKAIKEFAGRLKETITKAIDTYYTSNGGGYYLAEDTIEDIDNLVKEMTEAEKALHKINHNSLCETETYNIGS